MNNTLRLVESSHQTSSVISAEADEKSASRHFIMGNTSPVDLHVLQHEHIIPVFVKDNEPLISQADFIMAMQEIVSDIYKGERISEPQIRISHPIKGRIPEARNKPASMLMDFEKTTYFERMMFIIEVPGITSEVNGNTLSLTIGGVKAYNQDNVLSKKGSEEHFKIFVGFQNRVCTNLCVWTDGFCGDLRVRNFNELQVAIRRLILSYDIEKHVYTMKRLSGFAINENAFATMIGRARMYQHLPSSKKKDIPELLLGDQQLGTVVKDYYRDESFCRDANGDINLWRLYNLFTGANKSTYIDQFLDRSVNAYHFTAQLKDALEGKATSWFLS